MTGMALVRQFYKTFVGPMRLRPWGRLSNAKQSCWSALQLASQAALCSWQRGGLLLPAASPCQQ